MMSTIFWSWQSDLDPRVTRHVIRDALASAIEDLHAELEERHELTSDTQGVPGSPDIVATILAKIDAAAAFVGDVTPVAMSVGGRALANPNVLIELGYAKKALGLNRLIMVWNTAFEGAEVERLPFDMRGRRGPMSFHLPLGATKAQLREERDRLRGTLREALRLSISAAPTARSSAPEPAWQAAGPTSEALWFDGMSRLAINEGGTPGSKAVHAGPYAYVRILPRVWTPPRDFADRGTGPSILGDTDGLSWGMTRGGRIVYSGSLRASERLPLTNFAMHFRTTGEIWGVTPFATEGERGGAFFADAFIRWCYEFIETNVGYLKALGAGDPFGVRLGFTDMSGMRWITSTQWGGSPVALEEDADARFTLTGNAQEEILSALDIAWGQIAAAFGLSQPPREILVKQIRGF